MVAYYTWLAEIEGFEPKRTKVGDLKLKKPDDFYGIYKKLTTMISWVGGAYPPKFYDQYVWTPLVLLLCWEFNAMEFDANGVGHCYNNIFADVYLHGGEKVSGIYQYVDVFTPGGYLAVLIFAFFRQMFNEALVNATIGSAMAIAFYQLHDTIKLCDDTDKTLQISLFGQTLDLCGNFWSL